MSIFDGSIPTASACGGAFGNGGGANSLNRTVADPPDQHVRKSFEVTGEVYAADGWTDSIETLLERTNDKDGNVKEKWSLSLHTVSMPYELEGKFAGVGLLSPEQIPDSPSLTSVFESTHTADGTFECTSVGEPNYVEYTADVSYTQRTSTRTQSYSGGKAGNRPYYETPFEDEYEELQRSATVRSEAFKCLAALPTPVPTNVTAEEPIGGVTVLDTDDPAGDATTCGTNTPAVDMPNVDIRNVIILDFGNDGFQVVVTLAGSAGNAIANDFSWAVVLSLLRDDGTVDPWMIEIHDGVMRVGQLDPENGELVPDTGDAVFVDGDNVVFVSTEGITDFVAFFLQAFNMLAPDTDKGCDPFGPFNFPTNSPS